MTESEQSKLENSKYQWTDEQELLLKSWAEKASCYTWLHDKSNKYFDRRNKILGIPATILAVISGATLFATLDVENDYYIKVGYGMVSFGIGVLSGLSNFLGYVNLAERHKVLSEEFSSFTRKITTQLSISSLLRENSIEFLHRMRVIYDDLIERSPQIPESIIDEFNKLFQETNIAKPNITGGLGEIKIFVSDA